MNFVLETFPSIHFFNTIIQKNEICIENHEFFIKQTNRSKYKIANSNGGLFLSIPIIHKGAKQLYTDTEISYNQNWQKEHWKSMISCYRNSPFFEYYDYKFEHLFKQKHQFIFTFNIEVLTICLQCLNSSIELKFTSKFENDYLSLNSNNDIYKQVFDDRNGFIENCSILDLIFNVGPNALNFFIK